MSHDSTSPLTSPDPLASPGPPAASGPQAAYRDAARRCILDLVWGQWRALGVRGRTTVRAANVVDPEALLLLTLTIGRFDRQLCDAVLCWLDLNGGFVNVHRLRSLAKPADPVTRAALSAVAARLAARCDGHLKWGKLAGAHRLPEPVGYFLTRAGAPVPVPDRCDRDFQQVGLLRVPVREVCVAGRFPGAGAATLVLRLRALIGLSLRCEALCVLGSRGGVHPSELARLVGMGPRGAQSLLAEMRRSGLLQVDARGCERIYSLRPGPLADLLRPGEEPAPRFDAVTTYRELAARWLALLAGADPSRNREQTALLDAIMAAAPAMSSPLPEPFPFQERP